MAFKRHKAELEKSALRLGIPPFRCASRTRDVVRVPSSLRSVNCWCELFGALHGYVARLATESIHANPNRPKFPLHWFRGTTSRRRST